MGPDPSARPRPLPSNPSLFFGPRLLPPPPFCGVRNRPPSLIYSWSASPDAEWAERNNTYRPSMPKSLARRFLICFPAPLLFVNRATQCCGSGSPWIRIILGTRFGIRIRIPHHQIKIRIWIRLQQIRINKSLDPDPHQIKIRIRTCIRIRVKVISRIRIKVICGSATLVPRMRFF
jgi:hypothetical protein